MKTVEIVGDNYAGEWKRTRIACRAVIPDGTSILLSFETSGAMWMLPGGGLEPGESDRECCAREVAEETGRIIDVSDCRLEIVEYYGDVRWINRYFFGTVTGSTERRLTEREKESGLEPRWLPLAEILEIFSRHGDYAGTDELRRGTYLREYTALCELTAGE